MSVTPRNDVDHHHALSSQQSAKSRYRCAPIKSYPLGRSLQLVYLPLQRTAHVLSIPDLKLISSCSRFNTLSAHAEVAVRDFQASKAEECRTRLREFADLGLLISEGSVVKRPGLGGPRSPDRARISWLAIPTRSRPSELVRCLHSYIVNAGAFNRDLRFFIADDSRTSREQEACRAALRSVAAGTKMKLFYAGRDERYRLLDALTRDGEAPGDVVRFALFGEDFSRCTAGSNRNTILLHTLGALTLSVDDDTICRVSTVRRDKLDELTFGIDGEIGEFWFFSDRNAAMDFVSPRVRDIVAEHECLLGKSPCAVVATQADRVVNLSGACEHAIRSLQLNEGRIRVTMNGLVGDCGMHTNLALRLSTNTATRERLLRSEGDYRNALTSTEVVRQTLSPTICHAGILMAGFMGLDNRELLPPFFPIERNQDGLFGWMVANCLDQCYSGHVPWALAHVPAGRRTYNSVALSTVRISDVLAACFSTWAGEYQPKSDSERLRSLGQHLLSVSSLSQDGFLDVVRTALWQRASQVICHAEFVLQQFNNKPYFWSADLVHQIRTLQTAVARPDYFLPVDLSKYFQPSDVPGVIQGLVNRFGKLLYWWPTIVERTQALTTGRGLGREIL